MSQTQSSQRRLRRMPTFVFGLAVLFQLLIPFTQAIASATLGGNDDTVIICTPAGFVSVSISEDGATSERPGQPLQSAPCEFCQLCQLGGNGAFTWYDADTIDFAPTQFASQTPNLSANQFAQQWILNQQPSRAPPLSSGVTS